MKKRVAVLGATGSVGKSAIDVISQETDDFELVLLSAHSDREGLEKLGRAWPGAELVLAGGPGGRERLLTAIAAVEAHITINGIAGAAGLEPSMAVIEAGSDLALANKETVVMAGKQVFNQAAVHKVNILPMDSEHSAIFHLIRRGDLFSPAPWGDCILYNQAAERVPDTPAVRGIEEWPETALDEILLTASGGPFRQWSLDKMAGASPEAALAHPTWNMGPKISIDSASMANKGLEIIEATRFFNIPPEKIKVVIHPQSIVHSMIRLRDGAVYAQLARPDMRLPIHQVLYWPNSRPTGFGQLDFESLTLEFEKPDTKRFPMLSLAREAVLRDGLYPCAYNAANEVAVAAFLKREIGFLDIPRIVAYVLDKDWGGEPADIAPVLEADTRARTIAKVFMKDKI